MIAAALIVGGVALILLGLFVVGGAAKLGGPEDGRPGPMPNPLLSARLYPRDPWED